MVKSIGVECRGGVLRIAEAVREPVGPTRIVRVESRPMPEGAAGAPPEPRRNGNGTSVVAAQPAADVLSRTWKLPAAPADRLRAIVANRLEADLPMPLEQLAWGFRSAASGGRELMVLAQAARRERAAACANTLAATALHPTLLTTEAEGIGAFARYGLGVPADARCVVILASAGEWLVATLTAGIACGVRRIEFAADRSELAVRAARQAVDRELGSDRPTEVVWCGATIAEPAIQTLAADLSASARRAELTLDLVPAGLSVDEPDRLVEFAPAIGLALAGLADHVNWVRLGGHEPTAGLAMASRLDRALAQPRRLAMAAVAGVALAVLLHLGFVHSETKRMTNQLATATAPALPDFDVKVDTMSRLERYRIDVESIVSEVVRVVPDSVILTSVNLSRERRLTIKATGTDPKAGYALADALRKSPRFANVNPERASGNEFTLSADVIGVQKISTVSRGGTWK